MPQPVDLYEENAVDEAEDYLRRAKERERLRREADMVDMQRELTSQQAKARKSSNYLANKKFTYDYNGNPIIVHESRNTNLPTLAYQVKHSIQDAEVISPKPRQVQMREITNVKKPYKVNTIKEEQETINQHVIQPGVPTYDLLQPQAGVTYIENGRTKNSTKSTLTNAGTLISSTFGANARLSRNEYLQLTKSNSSLIGMSIRGRDFGTQITEKPVLQPITPPNLSQNRNISVNFSGVPVEKKPPSLTNLNHNSASTPALDSGIREIMPHSSKNVSSFAFDNPPRQVRPNTDTKSPQFQATNNMTAGLKENATNMMDATKNGTLSLKGNFNKGLVYYDSEKVRSLLGVDEEENIETKNPPTTAKQQETYQASYNPNPLSTNNNLTSKMSPVDLHNTNVINSKEWGKVNFSMTGASCLPILPHRKPQIGGINTVGGKNVRQRVNASGAGNSYVELLHSTIRNQQIV